MNNLRVIFIWTVAGFAGLALGAYFGLLGVALSIPVGALFAIAIVKYGMSLESD